MPELTARQWNEFYARHPQAHILQSPQWGALKAEFGWQPVWVVGGEAGAQVLFRRLPLGFTVAYIPKGPLGTGWDDLWPEVDAACRRRRAVFLKVETDWWESRPLPPPEGFIRSQRSVQPPRTLVVDLSPSEDEILARMKQKTRYNIRLAARKGVQVRPWDDLSTFHQMMVETGERDGFGVHTLAYYHRAYEIFRPRGECELLVAEYQGEPLAALMVFARGRRAWYLYGASSSRHRNRMPTYALQWEAMRWAKGRGCVEYDLWGVPDAEEAELEAGFQQRSDGLWGVYRFKRGFGGRLCRAAGPWERVYSPAVYRLYLWWLGRTGA